MAEEAPGADFPVVEEVTTELFSTAVSEEKLEEARLKSHRRLFGSSNVFLHLVDRQCQQKPSSLQDIVQEKITKLYEHGLNSLSREEWEGAVITFSKAIALDPERGDLYVKRAEAFLHLCDFQSAVLNLQKALSITPGQAEVEALLAFTLYLQGQCLYEQGRYLDALESFTQGAELQPGNSHFVIRSISCLSALGRPEDCIRLVNKQLEEDRQNPDLYVLRARLYDHLNKATLCYQDVQRALALDPPHHEAHALLEKLASRAEEAKAKAINSAVQGALDDALSRICFAIENNPSLAEYYIFRGTVYKRLKNYSMAVDDFVLAMQLCNTQSEEGQRAYEDAEYQLILTYNDFAVHCYMKGFYEEGIQLLKKALKGEKNKKELYMNRGDCFFQLGNLDFALADYQQALELDTTDWSLRTRVAKIHDHHGLEAQQARQYHNAELHFTKAIDEQPLLPQPFLHRAQARRCLQKSVEAQQDAVISILLNPKSEEASTTAMSFFPGKNLGEIMSSQLAETARRLLEKSVGELPVGWKDIHSFHQHKGVEKSAETAGKKAGIAVCVTDQQLLVEMVQIRKKINTEIKTSLNRRGQLKSTAPRISRPPPPDEDPPDPEAPYHWRTFGLGLTQPE
ncbi:tetratricopeptide repeat protein 16 [Discoglossus pictus]